MSILGHLDWRGVSVFGPSAAVGDYQSVELGYYLPMDWENEAVAVVVAGWAV